MGKRTMGEFQPFEFVIILAVADLACTPMQDTSIPILYGIVPLLTIFITHYLIVTFTSKSIRFRRILNGKPVIIIDGDGINNECLKKLNLDVNDILQMIRQQGYFSIEEIKFAVIETNGKMSVMENEQGAQPESIPLTVVVEGKFIEDNAKLVNVTKERIERLLKEKQLKLKDVLLLTLDSNKVFVQPINKKYFTFESAV